MCCCHEHLSVFFSRAAGPRTVFLETRYCLALLFGQLFQYRLREAQALCDTMVKQLLTLEDIVGKVWRNYKIAKNISTYLNLPHFLQIFI